MEPVPGSPEAHLEWLRGKLHRQWEVLADATKDIIEVRRDGEVIRAVLDGRAVTAVISYDD